MMTRTGNGFRVHVYKIMISCMRLHENLRRGAGFSEAEFIEANDVPDMQVLPSSVVLVQDLSH